MPRVLATLAVALMPGLAASQGANLLQNPDFDGSATTLGWESGAPGSIALDWDARDRSEAPGSGSLRVTNTLPNGSTFGGNGARQCVAVQARASYTFGGWIFVPSGQANTGLSNFSVFWYDTPDCSGDGTFGAGTDFVSDPEEWQQREEVAPPAPPGTRSAEMLLWLSKTEDGGSRSVLFDDVLFAPEPSGFALALVGLGTLARLSGSSSRGARS
jgi:hypothetical protein